MGSTRYPLRTLLSAEDVAAMAIQEAWRELLRHRALIKASAVRAADPIAARTESFRRFSITPADIILAARLSDLAYGTKAPDLVPRPPCIRLPPPRRLPGLFRDTSMHLRGSPDMCPTRVRAAADGRCPGADKACPGCPSCTPKPGFSPHDWNGLRALRDKHGYREAPDVVPGAEQVDRIARAGSDGLDCLAERGMSRPIHDAAHALLASHPRQRKYPDYKYRIVDAVVHYPHLELLAHDENSRISGHVSIWRCTERGVVFVAWRGTNSLADVRDDLRSISARDLSFSSLQSGAAALPGHAASAASAAKGTAKYVEI
jgi:hypothetical protein